MSVVLPHPPILHNNAAAQQQHQHQHQHQHAGGQLLVLSTAAALAAAGAISGRLFTMVDFVQNDTLLSTKQLFSESESTTTSSESESADNSSGEETNSNDNNSQQQQSSDQADRLLQKPRKSVVQIQAGRPSQTSTELAAHIRKFHRQRRKPLQISRTSNIFPDWHPLGRLNAKQRERFFFRKRQTVYLPVNKLNMTTSSVLALSQTASAPLPNLLSAGGGQQDYIGGNMGGQSSPMLLSNSNGIMVEIGPGGVPPSNLKTVRRRAIAQLQACETQIATFKGLWLKNGGKEGGIPCELDFLCADIDHIISEAFSSKAANEKMKKMGMQQSMANVAAPLHHQRISVTRSHPAESLASQQSSKISRNAAGQQQHASKKYAAEVNEIRKMTQRQQLRSHLQDLYDSKTTPIRQYDARGVIAKSLRVLERIGEYLQLFDMLSPNLHAIAGAVSRYCTSFIHEVENVQVDCVWSYNNMIISWQKTVESALLRMDESRKMIDRKEKNCAALLICDNDSEIARLMTDEGVEQMEQIVKKLKDWIVEDEHYETRLRDTLRGFMQQQKELSDSLKVDHRKKDELTRMALRRDFKASLIEHDGKSHANEGNRMQRVLEVLAENETKLGEKFMAKTKELDDYEAQHPGLPVDAHFLAGIETIKRQLSATQKRIRAIRLRMQLLESEIVNISQAKEANLEIGRRELVNAKRYNKMASEVETDLRLLETKIRAVVRIIDLKRNPDILKRIFYQEQQRLTGGSGGSLGMSSGFDPTTMYEPADTDQLMTSAIALIAQEIGHHLPELYRRLPFSPTRSADRRKRDLIQLGCREVPANYPAALGWGGDGKNDSGLVVVTSSGAGASSSEMTAELRKLAFQVLRKWRRLNKNVSVMQLAETLRSINQTRLADAIEAARAKTLGLPAIHSRAKVLVNSSSNF